MNTSLMPAVLVVTILFVPMGSVTADSGIKNSTISNMSQLINSANIAIGMIGKAEANQGSIVIKEANLNNSTVINNATVKNSANIAMGMGGQAEANQGVVKISRSLNGIIFVNDASIKNSANVAIDVIGRGRLLGTNESNQGSIVFK